jgi:hypothetical protein
MSLVVAKHVPLRPIFRAGNGQKSPGVRSEEYGAFTEFLHDKQYVAWCVVVMKKPLPLSLVVLLPLNYIAQPLQNLHISNVLSRWYELNGAPNCRCLRIPGIFWLPLLFKQWNLLFCSLLWFSWLEHLPSLLESDMNVLHWYSNQSRGINHGQWFEAVFTVTCYSFKHMHFILNTSCFLRGYLLCWLSCINKLSNSCTILIVRSYMLCWLSFMNKPSNSCTTLIVRG